jgi:hypothetical protein
MGTLSVGQTVQGDLSAASSCSFYPLVWDTTQTAISQSYNFSVQSGKGYLVSLLSTVWTNAQLIGGTTANPVRLEAADYDAPYQSTLPFVATATTTYSVRVSADNYPSNSIPADTGAYTLRAQSCKVPLPMVTDSVSHSDNLAPGDCTDPKSDFTTEDSSFVHIYTIHFDSAATRTIYISAGGAPVAFNIGGPGSDPYDYFGWGTSARNITSGSGTFTAGDSGVYTMVIGTNAYSATSQPYTITFGAEVPAASRVTPPPSAGLQFDGRAGELRARKHGH